MKQELDRLMKEKEIDAIIIDGFTSYDPNVFYFLQVPHLGGLIIKKRDEEPILVHGLMERDEARKTGLRLVEITQYEYHKITARQKDAFKAWAELVGTIFKDHGVQGRLCYYGQRSVSAGYYYVKALTRQVPNIQIVREPAKTIMQQTRETKEDSEVARIKSNAERTEAAVGDLVKFFKSHTVHNNHLVKDDGSPATIGDAKHFLTHALLGRGLVEISGSILSIGRDAGVPHSTGNDQDRLELGKTIILDVFPRELAGGYYYDFTRTFVLGKAPAEVIDAYKTVADGQQMLIDSFKVDARTRSYETKLCKMFERRGHPTPLSTPGTKQGYIHSLGHGLGLEVHEKPTFSLAKTNKDFIQARSLFTVEPGLYYPDKGYGVRLEDVVYINQDGAVENLSRYPKELVIEI